MPELTDIQLKELEKTLYLSTEDLKAEKIREERRIIHWISTPDLDRGRDIMMPKGMISEGFMKTKTVFADHNYYMPIGSNVKLAVTNDGVKATTFFSETPFANDRYMLHLEGVLNTWSIGFRPVRDKEGKILEDSIEHDDKTGKRTFHKWELLEYSDTGIPMNPDALDIAKNICKSVESMNEIETLELRMLIKTATDENAYLKSEILELKDFIGLEKAQGSMIAQTLIFSKDKFTKSEAVKWAKDHDYRSDKVDETSDSFRLRQRDPSDFIDGSFRTIEITDGIKAVVGKLKKSLILEVSNEFNKINSTLEKIVGNKSEKPLDIAKLRAMIKQNNADLFNEITGRKLKS